MTFGDQNAVETVKISLADRQRLVQHLLRVLDEQGDPLARTLLAHLAKSRAAVAAHWPTQDREETGAAAAAGPWEPEEGFEPEPGSEPLAGLKATGLTWRAKYPSGRTADLQVLGAYQLHWGKAVVCLCRDPRGQPPLHFLLRFGRNALGFESCSRVAPQQEGYLAWHQWAWVVRLPVRRPCVISTFGCTRKRAWRMQCPARKLEVPEIRRFLGRWTARNGASIKSP